MDLPFAAEDDASATTAVSVSSATTTASSSTGFSVSTGAELLHGHAPIVYDNLKSGHFGSTAAGGAGGGGGLGYSNLSTNPHHHVRSRQQQQQQQQQQHYYHNHHGNASTNTASPHGHPSSEDDAFVTVSGSDTDDFNFAAVDDSDEGRGGTLDDGDVYYRYGDGGEHMPHDADMFGQNILSDGTGGRALSERGGGQDVLSLLLSGPPNSGQDEEEEEKEGGGEGKSRNSDGQQASDLARTCEEAGRAARKAAALASPTKYGHDVDLEAAAARHARAAAKYREAAVLVGSDDATLSRSLLLLSVAQARSASNVLAKHRNAHPNKSAATDPGDASQTKSRTSTGMALSTSFGAEASSHNDDADSRSGGRPRSGSQSELQQERLRAKIRGAMDSGSKKEADMTDSMFLVGTSAKSASRDVKNEKKESSQNAESIRPADETSKQSAIKANGSDLSATNPVDDMMKLESELRSMDFALEMGSSVTSLGTRMTSARSVKSMDAEGSFCVVPGSASYMSSSIMRTPRPLPSRPTASNAISRAKANRVQGTPAATSPSSIAPTYQNVCLEDHQRDGRAAQSSGLESSWWGQPCASHMSASISSVNGRAGQQDNVSNTKELMRLLDTIKTLGDENVALMREVEEVQAARQEAKIAKEQMKRFKEEYSKRFRSLQAALEKFRKAYADNPDQTRKNHHLLSSDLASSLESQKKDQMIRQLAAELKKEKEDSKKKDAALRKYESFYREVKARSAQKAKQREQDQQRAAQQKKARAGIDRTAR